MKTIAIGKFKATCLKVLEQVSQTKQLLVITKRGKPLVRILPIDSTTDQTSLLGSIVHEDQIVLPAVDEREWNASR